MKKKVLTTSIFLFLAWVTCLGFSYAAEPYVIAYQTDITGFHHLVNAPQQEGFRLYMQTLNDRGGINGHPVKVIYEDDKSTPARAGAIAKKLILEDNVLLIAGLSFSHSHPPVYEVTRKDMVPVVVNFSSPAALFAPAENDLQHVFSTGPIMSPKFHFFGYAQATIVSKLFPKGKKVASMSYATPGGRTLSTWAARWAKERGYNIVYHEDIPPGTVDVSSWAQKVVNADPDVLMGSFSGELCVPLYANLEKMGWKKAGLVPSVVNTEDFYKIVQGLLEPRHNLYYFGEAALPPNFAEKSVPEYKKIEAAMKKYGHKYALSGRHGVGWLTAIVIEETLRKAGWPSDRAAVLRALEKTDVDSRGLTGGPIRFSKHDHVGSSYVITYRWDPDKKMMVDAMDWVELRAADIAKQAEVVMQK